MSVAQTTLSVANPALAHMTNGAREVEVSGSTLSECVEDLFRQYLVLRCPLGNDGWQMSAFCSAGFQRA